MALFHLGKNSRDTYYEQIRVQLILHVLCSNLKEGDKLPAIRDTARMLQVNPNTVFNIYRRLQADHLLEIRRGSGTYVGKSPYGINQFNEALLKFISSTFRQAEARFNLPPPLFADLVHRYIKKTGSTNDLYLVINDDETKDIDAALLGNHFSCSFVPLDVEALEQPSASTRQLTRNARGYITTRFHLDRVAKLMQASDKRLIEIRRDPRFVGDVLEAAAKGSVLVVFQQAITCAHVRDLVFKKLYPKISNNVSFATIGDKANVLDRVTRGDCRVYSSPLCYEAVKNMAPPQVEVVQIEGWISRRSLDDIRALLLYS
jgi:DNA-binding transcriptional regulator YhcF (GntR family)